MNFSSIGVGMRAVLRVDDRGICVHVHATRQGIATISEMEAHGLDDLSECATREMLASRIEQIGELVPIVDRWGSWVDVAGVVKTIRQGGVLS